MKRFLSLMLALFTLLSFACAQTAAAEPAGAPAAATESRGTDSRSDADGKTAGRFVLAPKDIAGASVEGIEANGYEFTGSAIEPDITIRDGGMTLIRDVDYMLSYENNQAIGTAKLTVTGKGDYTGSFDVYFKITKTQPRRGADYAVRLPDSADYSGTAFEAVVTRTTAGIGAITVRYNGETEKPVNAGRYAVTVDIAESAGYAAMRDVAIGSFTIAKKAIDVSGVALADKDYNGRVDDAVVTEVTFRGLVNNETLTPGTDFAAAAVYDRADAGDRATARATVTLKNTVRAGNYSLTNGTDFAVTGKVSKAVTTLRLSAASAVYTGAAYDEKRITKTSNVEADVRYTYYLDEACQQPIPAPVNAGRYCVKGEIAGTANQSKAEATAVFAITKAPLTVKAIDHSIVYGDTPETGGVEYIGLVNGESGETVVTGLTCRCVYEQYGAAGIYDIVPENAAAANYALTLEGGKLTVEPKEIGLQWQGDGTLFCDGRVKKVTATATGLVNGDEVQVTVSDGQRTAIGSYLVAAVGLTGERAGSYRLPAGGKTAAYAIVPALTEVTVTPATVTAAVDGLTIRLTGSRGEEETLCVTGQPGDVTAADGKLTVRGVEYAVDESAVTVRAAGIALREGRQPDAAEKPDAGIDSEVVRAINDDATRGEGLGNAAAAGLLAAAAEDAAIRTVEVTLNIEPLSYREEAGRKILRLELTPVVTYRDASGAALAGRENLPIANEAIKAPVTVRVKLPAGMPAEHLFARHELEGGGVEYLAVTVADGVASWQQSSFSAVSLLADSRCAKLRFTMADGSAILKTYTAEHLGEALPTDSKSDAVFKGWKLWENTYSGVLTDAMLTAMDGGSYTLTAAWSPNGGDSAGGGGGSAGGGGGGGAASAASAAYPVRVDETKNGTVTVSPGSAAEGDTVTVAVKPGEGYVLASLSVLDANGRPLAVTGEDGRYRFVMPAGGVTVRAEFVEKSAMPFADVAARKWYYGAVRYCVDNGLMNGVGEDRFAPSATTTRAMVWTILARSAGVKTSAGAAWYEAGRTWAMENGISDGARAETAVTREQLAAMLYRVAQSRGEGFTGAWYFPLQFDDASSVSGWADEAMHWCVMKGILNGSDNRLKPRDQATRAEVAAMLMRFLMLDE